MKNMIGTGSALERLKKLIPPGVEPKFGSVEEWRTWQAEEGRKRCEELEKQNQRTRAEKIFGRAGIQDLHRSCTFANYQVAGDGQRRALTMAKSYAQNFGSGFASFVFSGAPGTGKNHLAAAIGNHLLAGGRSVLVVTIPDLMLRVRECYDDGQSEASLLDDLCRVDLLILDEVGIQRGSSGEKGHSEPGYRSPPVVDASGRHPDEPELRISDGHPRRAHSRPSPDGRRHVGELRLG